MYSTKCQHFTLGSLYQLSLSQHGLLSLTLRWTHRLLWGKGFLDTEYRTTTPLTFEKSKLRQTEAHALIYLRTCWWPKCWGSQSSFDDKHTLLYELNTLQLMYSTKCQHFTLGSLYQLSLSQHGLLSLTLRWTHRLLWGKGFLDTEYRTTTPRNRWGFVLSPSIFQSFFKLFVRIFRCSFPLCVYSISQQAKFLFA